ncbi:MAG: hypothetical protein V2I82_11690 [Halieaceae bacterium]|nr:hypothetical protein [Halieaceae bacterium]
MSETQARRMGAAGYLTIAVAVGYVGLELYALQHSRERVEPEAIYAQFIGARRAVERCGGNEARREDFERNLRAVSARALRELVEERPAAGAEALAATLAEQRAEREAEVDALLDTQGCAGADARRLIKLYEVRSRLSLRS